MKKYQKFEYKYSKREINNMLINTEIRILNNKIIK